MSDRTYAGLHGGLIERVRPSRPVPPTVMPVINAPDVQSPLVRVQPYRAALAEPLALAEDPADDHLSSEKVDNGHAASTPPGVVQRVRPMGRSAVGAWSKEHIFGRRLGLTLRVERAVRARLTAEQRRSGRTAQSILHTALTQYLDWIDGDACRQD